jgi:hypothetical protein
VAALVGLMAIPVAEGAANVIVRKIFNSLDEATWRDESFLRRELQWRLALGVAIAGATPLLVTMCRNLMWLRRPKACHSTGEPPSPAIGRVGGARGPRRNLGIVAALELTVMVAVSLLVLPIQYFGASLPAPLVMLVLGRRWPNAVPIFVPLSLAAIFAFWVFPTSFINFGRLASGRYLGMNPEEWFGTTVWFILSGTALTALCTAFSTVRYFVTRRRYFVATALFDAMSLLAFVVGGCRFFLR